MKTLKLATTATCGPCFAIKSKLKSMGLTVDIMELNGDNIEFFKKHSVTTVPRLLVFDGETLADTIQGMENIIKKIKEYADDQKAE